MDDFDELWAEREELLSIEEAVDICSCDEFGEDACPVHTQLGLEVLEEEDVEKLTIKKRDSKED